MKKYRINWDNGADAAGTFPYTFDTYKEADDYGKDWADEANIRDFGEADPSDETLLAHDADAPYSYEVIEVDVDSEDDDPDNDEGYHHQMLRDKWAR